MCGIIGYITKDRTDKEIAMLWKLIQQSKIRGLHAFGYSYVDKNDNIATFKAHEITSDFLDFFINENSKTFIFHARYSTSGDWNNMRNNQPIVVDNKAIALNGVISMKKKEEFEKDFGVKCETENDAEILLRTKAPLDEFMLYNDSASIAAVIIQDGQLMAIRNNKRPLYYFHYESAIFIVSTVDIARRAGYDGQIAVVEPFREVSFNV